MPAFPKTTKHEKISFDGHHLALTESSLVVFDSELIHVISFRQSRLPGMPVQHDRGLRLAAWPGRTRQRRDGRPIRRATADQEIRLTEG